MSPFSVVSCVDPLGAHIMNHQAQSSWVDPELELAVSYYNLFQQEARAVSLSSRQNVDTTTTTPNESLQDLTQEDDDDWQVWKDYQWTQQDTQQAQAILQDGYHKCVIDPSLRHGTFHHHCSRGKTTGHHQDKSTTTTTTPWDQFYQHHQTNFFKDRHYFATAFPEEFGSPPPPPPPKAGRRIQRCLVEVGCGVGNACLPLLETCRDTNSTVTDIDDDTKQYGVTTSIQWTVYAFDVSAVAIDLLQQDKRFLEASQQGRAFAYQCDITQGIPKASVGVANVTTLLFCLSAIAPEQHIAAALHVAQTLKETTTDEDEDEPESILVIRDYGLYDAAQLKLASQRNKLLRDDQYFYRKHDGTQCFYFTTQDLERLFVKHAGLQVVENRYLCRVYQNRSTQTLRKRVWVQARFRKPKTKGHS